LAKCDPKHQLNRLIPTGGEAGLNAAKEQRTVGDTSNGGTHKNPDRGNKWPAMVWRG